MGAEAAPSGNAMTELVPATPPAPPALPPEELPQASMPRPLRRLLGLVLLFAGLAIPGCVALVH